MKLKMDISALTELTITPLKEMFVQAQNGTTILNAGFFIIKDEIISILIEGKLEEAYINDLKDCDELDYTTWIKQSKESDLCLRMTNIFVFVISIV